MTFFFTMFNSHVTFYELNNLSFFIKNIIKQYFVVQCVEPKSGFEAEQEYAFIWKKKKKYTLSVNRKAILSFFT